MPKISMGKKYRARCGEPARILCIDSGIRGYPVVAVIGDGDDEVIESFTDDGHHLSSRIEDALDLIEDTPYTDFKIDEPVMVRDYPFESWSQRHFAGIDVNGCPLAWNHGQTSYTTQDRSEWRECRRPTEQELKGNK